MLKRLTLLLSGAAAFVARPLRVVRPKRTTPQMVLAPAAAQVVRVGIPTVVAAVAGVLIKQRLDRPSRPYEDGSVGREYDAWTREGILEHYWGEHIHLGYYTDDELDRRWFGSKSLGFLKKNFIEAKYNFTQRMLDWGGISGMQDAKILDVGCGIGGTTRYMANLLPNSTITGITLSPEQAKRATDLAAERNVPNANFQVMDALQMDFPDNSFDVVWGCESGEHMPDKKLYVQEMARVLKPGGLFLFDTINRNPLARLAVITMAEDVLGLLPKGTHDPEMFIKPSELRAALQGAGFSVGQMTGLGPRGISRRGDFTFGRVPGTAIIYMGTARLPDR